MLRCIILYLYYCCNSTTEFICYDDACHLRRFARNPIRANLTQQATQLASVEMAVDKMHMKGHTDPWCKDNCDPAKFQALAKVYTRMNNVGKLVNVGNLVIMY